MKSTRLFLPLLCIFSLLFAQQAGAAHAVHHAFEDLTHQQKDKQTPHPGACEQCANYAQLGSALNVGTLDFIPPIVSGETIQLRSFVFCPIHSLAAAARGPPYFS
ncbi:MAG TPA: hypothetical protein VMJ33_06910 [Gallionella sp.]|nr:hypothetical protein [Gallionella sp.]